MCNENDNRTLKNDFSDQFVEVAFRELKFKLPYNEDTSQENIIDEYFLFDKFSRITGNDLEDRELSDTPVGERPTLREGNTGEWVRELQKELKQVTFFNGTVDGIFGPITTTAVKNFQTANKLTADGVVGRNTWSALIFLYAPLATCPNNDLDPYPFKGVVIDAGHGGSDPGAVGNDLLEKDLTLMISMYMNDRFYELNVPHELTRTTDETMTNAERVARVKNAFGADPGVILISNHINAGGGEGAEVIYALRNANTFATMILNEIKLAGQVVRRVYQRTLPSNPELDYYYIIRDTAPIESVLVEYGFIDNEEDAQRLRFNWQRYAEAVVKATCDYIGFPYKPPYSDVIVYIVQEGDTLWSIARKFNITVEELKIFNNLTSDLLRVGQVLKIPGSTSPIPPVEETFTHTVVAGDTLWSLANRFNTTVDEIMRINNLTSTTLTIGQTLRIPGSMPSYFNHTVVAGDTLWSLANRFNTTVNEIMSLNNLTTSNLSIGQVLKIPRTGN